MEQGDAGVAVPEKEAADETLRPVDDRLLLDTHFREVPLPDNFDGWTGEDLRKRPNESLKRMLTQEAVGEVQQALGLSFESKFSGHTGRPLPKAETKQAVPDYESWSARLEALRGEMGEKVNEAEARGVSVPRFDAETGQPLPKNSLRVYEAVHGRRQPQEAPPSMSDQEALEMGLSALREMKAIRREDEAARKSGGLLPRS